MASTLKVLAQTAPAATTSTDSYTVPGATSTVVASVTICNENSTSVTVRLSVAVAGAALATKQYVLYDVTLLPNETKSLTLGITLAATDVVRVYASATLVAFSLFGQEVT